MKFRLAGGLEAPDWLLGEIAVLSRLSAVRTKILAGQIIKQLETGELEWAKVTKLTGDGEFSGSDVKAAVAALRYIMSNAAKYDITEGALTNELQQLGLPAANCASVVRPFVAHSAALREALERQSLALPRLDRSREVEWRVDVVLDSKNSADVNIPTVQLKIPVAGDKDAAMEISSDKFRVLLNELKQARALMETLDA